jgi:cytosine/adenosine deaminase-related metal-dependent hydrolase
MTPRPHFPCPAESCRRVFRTSVALRFHVSAEHPSGLGEFRPEIRKAQREERRVKAESAEERGRKTLDALYRLGCPCNRSYEEHMREREGRP